MIPAQNVITWGAVVPWADIRQIEQVVIIGGVIVDNHIFTQQTQSPENSLTF